MAYGPDSGVLEMDINIAVHNKLNLQTKSSHFENDVIKKMRLIFFEFRRMLRLCSFFEVLLKARDMRILAQG